MQEDTNADARLGKCGTGGGYDLGAHGQFDTIYFLDTLIATSPRTLDRLR